MTLKEMTAQLEAKATEAQTLYAKGDAATTEDLEAVKTYAAEIKELEAQIEERRQFEAEAKANAARIASLNAPTPMAVPSAQQEPQTTSTNYAVPRGHASSFATSPNSEEKAYRFGQWFAANIGRNPKAQSWCREHGLMEFVMSGDSVTAGSALVPTEFKPDMQVLLERYSGLRQCCTPWPMNSDTMQVPRTTAGLTVYSPGQGTAITASDPTTDMITLKADTFLTLTYVSNELMADSPVSVGNLVFDLIARAFGANEDDMFINGDGTSTYFGRLGLAAAFRIMDPSWNSTTLTNVANIAGAYVLSNKAFGSQVMADLMGVAALLPEYADNPNTKWLCSRAYYTQVMCRLAYAQGGSTAAEVSDGIQPRFLGYPVIISQKAPRIAAGAIDAAPGGIPVFLGDFTQGVAFGDRQEYTLATSEHVGFASNVIGIRGSVREDIVVHGVGNYSATAASRQPGPIVCGISPHT